MSKHLILRLLLLTILLPASGYCEQVIWNNAVNVSTSGGTITKTNGTSAWDAGASSANVIRDGYGFMEFTTPNTIGYRVAGLSYGDTDQNYTDIDYGINLRIDTVFAVYENGTLRGTFGNYNANDVFRVEVRYGVVRYLRNGAVFYTSTVAPRYPLRLDISLKDPNASLTNVRLGNLVWTGASSVSISGESLTKTGSAGWNGGAASTNTIESGDGFTEFTATETNTTRMAGLGNGDTDQSDGDIEFGIELRDDGYVEVVESGVSRGMVGSYLAGDRLRVELTSGVVRYYNNGLLLYTSGLTPSYPLRADTSLYTVGATLTDLSLETLVWSGTTGVLVNGARLVKTAADGWNANASSTQSITQLDGWLEFTAVEANTRRVAGLKTAGPASDYTGIDFAIELGSSGIVTVWELGTSRGTFGSYTSGDRLRVEIQDGVVRYRKNGTIFYTSTTEPSYPLHAEAVLYTNGATLADVAMGLVVWRGELGITFLGNTLMKTGTSSAWDSGAFSTKAINSGSVEWMAFETTKARITGLGQIDSNQNFTDVDFGIMTRYDGTVGIFESGTLRAEAGTYAPGDRFKVEVSNNTVKYYRNGTLLYTSNVAPTGALNVDSAIHGPNGTLFHIALDGDPVSQQLDPPSISPPGSTYTAEQSVTLTHAATAVTIRYTTDGSMPTTTSTVYSGPFAVTQTTTVKARAWKTTFLPSDTASATYTLLVPNPSISPGSATYNNPPTVTLSDSVPGATIRYTTDGTDPTSASTAYTGPITVDMPMTLKARAFKGGWLDSNIVNATYTFKVATPTLTPSAGNYNGTQTVAITTATGGATLRYTADGSIPTSSSPVVPTEGVVVDKSTTVKVQGFRAGWTASDIRQGTYIITLGTVATPAFSPSAGSYTWSRMVSISSMTSGVTIRVTTDGTDPTVHSTIYSSPILIETTTLLKAKAFKGDYAASVTASGLYVIDLGTVDTPRLSPGSGSYVTSQTITVTTETSGATIHYTTNGNDPTESDPTVASGGTLTIDRSKSLKVKAWKSGMPESGVGRGDYHITGAVALGWDFTIALKADGSLWSWGTNGSGQLGLGSTGGTHTTPSQITSTSGFIAISAGTNHTLAVKSDGTAWAWGSNSNGQLGDGTMTTRTVPVQVNTLTNVIAISAGQFHSLALRSDGTVWEWGSDNLTNYGTTPVQIAGLKGITAIGTKRNHCFALQTDGEESGVLWVWGYNDLAAETSGALSALGDGSLSNQPTPVRVTGMSNVVKFSAGWDHAFALKQDGSVWGWGLNHLGQLGDGSFTGRNIPIQTIQSINPADPILSLGAGRAYGLLAQRKKTSGQSFVWTWGNNTYLALGVPTVDNPVPYPVLSLMTGAFDTAVAERDFAAALHLDGGLWMWGYNGAGQLGDGTTTNHMPTAITGFSLVDNGWLLTDDDEDGLEAWVELEIGTDPGSSDTNGDGISDGAAFGSGKSATNSDVDGDGVSNIKERELSTDPFRADTDNDGPNDAADCFPLDPSRSACPSSNPSDTTPPAITLTRPTNATLTGSNP